MSSKRKSVKIYVKKEACDHYRVFSKELFKLLGGDVKLFSTEKYSISLAHRVNTYLRSVKIIQSSKKRANKKNISRKDTLYKIKFNLDKFVCTSENDPKVGPRIKRKVARYKHKHKANKVRVIKRRIKRRSKGKDASYLRRQLRRHYKGGVLVGSCNKFLQRNISSLKSLKFKTVRKRDINEKFTYSAVVKRAEEKLKILQSLKTNSNVEEKSSDNPPPASKSLSRNVLSRTQAGTSARSVSGTSKSLTSSPRFRRICDIFEIAADRSSKTNLGYESSLYIDEFD